MAAADFDRDALGRLVTDIVLGPDFRRATFGGPARGARPPWVRVVVRPLELRGERHLQFSYFDSKKDITKNFRTEEARGPLDEVLAVGFAGIHLATQSEEIDIRVSKKGKVFVGRRKAAAAAD